MSEWRIRVWRVVALGIVVALLLGMIVILPAYLHMRGVAASRAAEIKTIGAQLEESRRAHEAALAENRVTAESLKGTASDLEALKAAQQTLADQDRKTSQTLQDTATDLGQLHAAQQLALCETQASTESMTKAAAETRQATVGLQELQGTEQMTADQNSETSQALQQTAEALGKTATALEMTANEYRESIQDLQDAIGQLATTQRPSWPGGPTVPSVTKPGAEAQEGYTGMSSDEASSLWVDGFSAVQSRPSAQSTSTRAVSAFDDNVAAQAKSLIWKYLGRPPYRVFVISQTETTVQNLWHVMGRFAPVQGETRTFAAGLRFLPSGKWMLLSFCWLATTASTSAEPACPAARECPPCPPCPTAP